jgi:hypothetical protein
MHYVGVICHEQTNKQKIADWKTISYRNVLQRYVIGLNTITTGGLTELEIKA